MLDDGNFEYIYGIDRTPIAQISKSDGSVSYLHHDSIGSVIVKTSAEGVVAGETSYSPYGENLGNSISSFGFAGEWHDVDTGYSYLRARWMDPETGTFLSRDPAVQSTGDAYGYASGNPLGLVDPLGLCSVGAGELGNLASDCYDFANSSAFLEINNFMAGFGDAVSMGGTKAIRELSGTNDQVNSCSSFYTAGEIAGTAASMVTPGGVAKASGTTVAKAFKNTWKAHRDFVKKYGEEGAVMLPFSGGKATKVARGVSSGQSHLPSGFQKHILAGDGIIYYRVDTKNNIEPYVGQAKNMERYIKRQIEHDKKHPNANFDFEVIGTIDPANKQLRRLEEYFIRNLGGIKKEGGLLSNSRHEMIYEKYKKAGGDF